MNKISETKICSKCKIKKPSSEFWKHKKDGLQAQCRICLKLGKRKGDRSREEIIYSKNPSPGMRKCCKCHKVLSIECFNGRSGDRQNDKRTYCKSCQSKIFENWHRSNGGVSRQEMISEIRHRNRPSLFEKLCTKCNRILSTDMFQKNASQYDGLRQHCSECRIKSERDYYNANKDLFRLKRKEFREKNLDLVRLYSRIGEQKRRALMNGIISTLTKDEWSALLEVCDNKCLCCGRDEKITMDHIIPVSMGGTHTIDNIQPLCSSCNSTKHTQAIDYRSPIIAEIQEIYR